MPISFFIGLWKNGEKYYSLTNPLFSNLLKRHVRRPKCQRFSAKYNMNALKLPKPDGLEVKSKHETARLHFPLLGTTVNGLKYVKLFQEELSVHMAVCNTSILIHDGALCRKSKVVFKYLTKCTVAVIDWPGSSPDLNPIENLWSNMKNEAAEKQPSSATELVTAIKEVCIKEISPEYCAFLFPNNKYAQPSCCSSARERWCTHKIQ